MALGCPRIPAKQIVERGNHDTLMELGGEYASMWNIQVQEREKMLEMEAVSAGGALVSPTLFVVVFAVAGGGGGGGGGGACVARNHRTLDRRL